VVASAGGAPHLPHLRLPSLGFGGDTTHEDTSVVSAPSDVSTPTQARASPFGFPYNLGTKHANISHGDLTTLARRRTGELEGAVARRQAAAIREGRVPEEEDEYGTEEDEEEIAEYGEDDEDEYGYSQYPQDAYRYQQHVLSPIPSEAEGSEVSSRQNSQASRAGAYSPAKSYRSETPSAVQSLGGSLAPGSLAPPSMAASAAPSNFLGVGGFNAAKESEVGGGGPRSTYAEESEVGQKPVGRVAAMARMINVPMGVESAVASLVDGSVATESHIGYQRGGGGGFVADRVREVQVQSRQQQQQQQQSSAVSSPHSRSSTPSVLSVDSSRRESAPFDEEYEPDDYGHKQRYQPSPLQTSASRQAASDAEAAITAGAVAALRAKQQQQQQQQQEKNGAGVSRAFSFQQRGNDEENLSTRSSREELSTPTRRHPRMGASGLPDWNDPLPEAEYMRHTLIDGEWDDGGDEDGRRTPTQRSIHGGEGQALTVEAMARVPDDRALSDDEGGDGIGGDRKRDTLVTNPYEDTSPTTTNPGLAANLRGLAGYANGGGFNTGSPGLHVNKLLDEGYMSQGAARTPEGGGPLSAQQQQQAQTPSPGPGAMAQAGAPAYLRNLSAMSSQSPLYDGASSGMDIDSIESRDIMSLMQFVSREEASKSRLRPANNLAPLPSSSWPATPKRTPTRARSCRRSSRRPSRCKTRLPT
jgi:hypothetical protein